MQRLEHRGKYYFQYLPADKVLDMIRALTDDTVLKNTPCFAVCGEEECTSFLNISNIVALACRSCYNIFTTVPDYNRFLLCYPTLVNHIMTENMRYSLICVYRFVFAKGKQIA